MNDACSHMHIHARTHAHTYMHIHTHAHISGFKITLSNLKYLKILLKMCQDKMKGNDTNEGSSKCGNVVDNLIGIVLTRPSGSTFLTLSSLPYEHTQLTLPLGVQYK